MSATLCWRPVSKDHKTLPDALKFVLRDKKGLGSEPAVFDRSMLAYLCGLEDAGIKGARELIDAIEKHDAVELWLEY